MNKLETKPKVVHTIYLIRHGDYDQSDPLPDWEGKALLKNGREQARLTGEWLKNKVKEEDTTLCSDFTRAIETSKIISEALDNKRFDATKDLRECEHKYFKEFDQAPSETLTNITSNPKQYFQSIQGANIVIVCHANLIRYVISNLFDLDYEQWKNFYIGNCSISTLVMNDQGKLDIDLLAYEEHIPENLRT